MGEVNSTPLYEPRAGEPEKKNFLGYEPRECGEHRSVGAHRAWCYGCTEWCYPPRFGYPDDDPMDGACKGCWIGSKRG